MSLHQRPTFKHCDITCHVMAELRTSNVRDLLVVLDTFSRLSVPITCYKDHMLVAGTSVDLSTFLHLRLCPMRSERDMTAATAAASNSTVSTTKKRKIAAVGSDSESDNNNSDNEGSLDDVEAAAAAAAAAVDVAEDGLDVFRDDSNDSLQSEKTVFSDNDFYKLYDEKTFSVQVDMQSLNKMLTACKDAVALSICIVSHSDTGTAERIMFRCWDNKSMTTGGVRLQVQSEDEIELRPIPTAFAITMPANEFSRWIKDITKASESNNVAFYVSAANGSGGGGGKQVLTLTSIGDNGEIYKEISPNEQFKFANDIASGKCDVDYRSSYSAKPLLQVCGVAPVSKSVRVYLSADAPLKLVFHVPDIGILVFFLAAKIEEENQHFC